MSFDRSRPEPTGRPRATLLVFTLDAASERARRRLLPGRLGSWELALYRESLDATLAAGRANGCELTVCAPRPLRLAGDVEQFAQRGRGFGDRLRQAVASQAPSPEQPLVVVGSDTPELAPRHVAAALERLGEDPDRLVVGPSPDGGFYLLAAARPVDELLDEVRWQRPDTLASLLAAARARGIEVSLLEPLADLDRTADLEDWLARGTAATAAWLRGLVASLRLLRRPVLPSTLGRPRLGRLATVPVRGPPR
jgi:2-phospho-L-lactate guanylyltransferase (CobY/MobA/RfbA family)